MTYRIGYKQPPPHSRFQKGKSGNPAGRPRKLPTFRSVLEAELCEATRIVEDDLAYNVTKQRAVAKALVAAALRGDMRAIGAIATLTSAPEPDDDTLDPADEAALQQYVDEEIVRRTRTSSEPDAGPQSCDQPRLEHKTGGEVMAGGRAPPADKL